MANLVIVKHVEGSHLEWELNYVPLKRTISAYRGNAEELVGDLKYALDHSFEKMAKRIRQEATCQNQGNTSSKTAASTSATASSGGGKTPKATPATSTKQGSTRKRK